MKDQDFWCVLLSEPPREVTIAPTMWIFWEHVVWNWALIFLNACILFVGFRMRRLTCNCRSSLQYFSGVVLTACCLQSVGTHLIRRLRDVGSSYQYFVPWLLCARQLVVCGPQPVDIIEGVGQNASNLLFYLTILALLNNFENFWEQIARFPPPRFWSWLCVLPFPSVKPEQEH